MHSRALCLAAAFLVVATAAPAADWPQWRGPNQDGVCTETGLLKSWPKDGPPVAWTAKNLGTGHGTPTVAGGTVYGMGNRDGKDGIWAVKESDGSNLWFTPIDDAKKENQNNGPGGAPAVANGKVYGVSNKGKLACVDATTGKDLWKVDLVKDYRSGVPAWGFNESVLVDGDKVICSPGSSAAGLAAFNANTGKEIWKSAVPKVGSGYGYSTPVKATIGGVPQYVCLVGGDKEHTSGGVIGVRADTGKLLWQYQKVGSGTAAIPTVIVKGDLVWCSVGYDDGGSALLRLTPAGPNKFDVKELRYYSANQLKNHHGGMVLVDDHVYFGHGQNQGNPACVDFKTGEIKWGPEKYPTSGKGSAAYLYADGLFYVRYQTHVMALLQMDPDGLKVISAFEPPGHTKQQAWAHPVIANGKLYIRDQGTMTCYNVKAPGAN
jgi:outer membrane protein assembly factor BamB